jgi:hypothetical protein
MQKSLRSSKTTVSYYCAFIASYQKTKYGGMSIFHTMKANILISFGGYSDSFCHDDDALKLSNLPAQRTWEFYKLSFKKVEILEEHNSCVALPKS